MNDEDFKKMILEELDQEMKEYHKECEERHSKLTNQTTVEEIIVEEILLLVSDNDPNFVGDRTINAISFWFGKHGLPKKYEKLFKKSDLVVSVEQYDISGRKYFEYFLSEKGKELFGFLYT